jgi:hypothetical protein
MSRLLFGDDICAAAGWISAAQIAPFLGIMHPTSFTIWTSGSNGHGQKKLSLANHSAPRHLQIKKKSGNMGQVPRFYDWLNFHNGTKKTIERWLKFNGFPNEDEFWLIPNRNEL